MVDLKFEYKCKKCSHERSVLIPFNDCFFKRLCNQDYNHGYMDLIRVGAHEIKVDYEEQLFKKCCSHIHEIRECAKNNNCKVCRTHSDVYCPLMDSILNKMIEEYDFEVLHYV